MLLKIWACFHYSQHMLRDGHFSSQWISLIICQVTKLALKYSIPQTEWKLLLRSSVEWTNHSRNSLIIKNKKTNTIYSNSLLIKNKKKTNSIYSNSLLIKTKKTNSIYHEADKCTSGLKRIIMQIQLAQILVLRRTEEIVSKSSSPV